MNTRGATVRMCHRYLWTALLCLGAAFSGSGFCRLLAQQLPTGSSLSGRVVDGASQPVTGSAVELRSDAGSVPLRLMTDQSGEFAFRALGEGRYTLSASAGSQHSLDVAVTLPRGASQKIELVLPGAGAALSRPAVVFSDEASFSIAGVTDWTAVGGHGSDATLRTSEDLARETLALKAKERASSGPERTVSAADREEELRLTKQVQLTPRSYGTNRELGEFYLRTAQFQNAVPPLKRASELSDAEPEDEYRLALACRGAGDLGQARLHVESALAKKDLAEYRHLAGEIDERLGDAVGAVHQDELAARLDPSESNYLAWGSELLLHRAVWQASEVLGRGSAAHPDSARLRTAWGAALFAGALYDDAAQRLCEASDLRPADAEPYVFMGKIVMAAPAPMPCVQEKLKRYAALQPENAQADYFYAMAVLKVGRAADAELVTSLLRKVIRLDPRFSDAYVQLGILSFAQHKYTDALALYERAVWANPQNGEAHYRLGVAYERAGDAARARQELALHDQIETAQAALIEQQRREIKQFVVDARQVPDAAKP